MSEKGVGERVVGGGDVGGGDDADRSAGHVLDDHEAFVRDVPDHVEQVGVLPAGQRLHQRVTQAGVGPGVAGERDRLST